MKWKNEFCPSLKLKNTKYPWEEVNCSAHGNSAMERYESLEALQYYVMLEPSESSREIALTSEKPLQPDTSGADSYVFPKNLAWCMCFTHEDGYIGPVFSESVDFKEKHAKNVKSVMARTKGYL